MQQVKMVKDNGIALVTIGTPKSIYLTAQTGDELDAVTREIESDQSVRAVVFTGGSPGVFIQHYSVPELVLIAQHSPGTTSTRSRAKSNPTKVGAPWSSPAGRLGFSSSTTRSRNWYRSPSNCELVESGSTNAASHRAFHSIEPVAVSRRCPSRPLPRSMATAWAAASNLRSAAISASLKTAHISWGSRKLPFVFWPGGEARSACRAYSAWPARSSSCCSGGE